ncbi:universal stress protein [Desulfohalobium retbaense]|uniref:UspA domain protein n=1 Tax=Desulfohalobium retbaense (strain ATCC 49708 / DSM 5692 / JCM 16813 / HR100) TaxID=485915 RepID=C8X087_DESRD|nr:universal stress protein [Desulfohalobium retbaense]ACV67712.1 UspA domain protein [Desulfohalobium retbaense DSM 5692]
MFKDIVLAATSSQVTEAAADAAFAFARKHDARLIVTHVCGLPSPGWGAIEHMIPSGEVERIKKQIQEYYGERTCDLENCCYEVIPGVPHSELLRLARKVNADLIVMGTHTKEFAEKRAKMWGMAGSTLERVSQKARCPVMVVSRPVPETRMDFKNIVVATDFSYQAECAMLYAGQMARQYKAALHVFHVLENGSAGKMATDQEIDRVKQRMADEFDEKLKGVQEYHFETWEGTPAMEILKFARLKDADLIIMAHHSKETDPEKAYLGSTVAQVALNASCPTMSVNRHFDLRCALYD